MTIKEMKSTIDRKGIAYATLFNNYGEKLFLGNVVSMNSRKGRLNMTWKVTTTHHTSPFTAFMIHDESKLLYTEEIIPFRADMGIKKFDVELNLS
jgi:hypothetical protein